MYPNHCTSIIPAGHRNLIPEFPLAGHTGLKDLEPLEEKRIKQNEVGVWLWALDVIVPGCSSG